jgi:hypothetical protein
MKEDFKFKTIFSSIVKPLVSEEKDKYLALASHLDIAEFVPDIDTSKEIDLLPLAFNACVANRVNRNGDAIDTNTAIAIYKSFINKPINVEHNRQRVIGTILVAGFSEFGTDKPLSEDEVKDLSSPFNITLGGVAWRIVHPELSNVIEESNDPTSKNYLKISASWELGFSDYELIVAEKEDKNIESATVVSNEQEIEALKECLKALGGSGQTEDGRYIYRKVVGQVVPLGIGLTETPAADVQGVTVLSKESEDEPEDKTEGEIQDPKKLKQLKKIKEKENCISQSNEKNVKKVKKLVMKIESLKDINDETLKELSASAISDFIEEELNKATEKYLAETQEVENKLKATGEELDTLKKSADISSEDLEKVKADLEALQKEAAAKEAEIKFVNRMTSLDEEYVLSDEDREVLAVEIKDMSDENFEIFSKKMEVLMDSKKREIVEAAEAEKAEVETENSKIKKTEEVKASEETPETPKEIEKSASEVVEEAIDSSETEASDLPVSAGAEEPTVFEKYEQAFSPENWIQK